MERSEPSLVPEWLRSNGGGSSIHHVASSQTDGPILALPGRSRSSKSISNTDSLHSPRLDRSSSSNSRRSSNSNGFSNHDKGSSALSYSSFSRNNRDRDRERSTIAKNWDSKYSDPLRGMISGRVEDPLRRSKSLVSRRHDEAPYQRIPSDMSNGGHKNHYNGNGTNSVGGNVTGTRKVLFERDFPVLRSEERPKTPDLIRVSSPGLSRGIQSLSIGSEAWTSALAEIPSRPSSSCSVSVQAGTSSGLNMAEALVQAPAQALNTPQQSVQLQKEELALAQSRKLIPMTPLLPKTLALSSSDKLRPKTPLRTTETAVMPKNGVHHLPSLQLGSQSVRGANVRVDSPMSPSSGKLLVLKPGRENGVSSALKDLQSPTNNIVNRIANGQSTGNPSVASGPSKNSLNSKSVPGDRKTPGVDKRTSRSNFFKLMREKSLNNAPGPTCSGDSVSSDVGDKLLDKEAEELGSAQVTPVETGRELKCNGETCIEADSFSPSLEIDNEKERAFLLSLGWEDQAEGDEDGLTEEEIYAFYRDEVMKQGPTSRLCRVLQAKVFSHIGCSSSNEATAPSSQTKA